MWHFVAWNLLLDTLKMEAAVSSETLVPTAQHPIPKDHALDIHYYQNLQAPVIFYIWGFYPLFSLPLVYNSPSPTPGVTFLKRCNCWHN
jgi:hypothetical protein